MNYQKYSLFVLIGAIVVFAITSIGMIQINYMAAEETEDKGYTFAEENITNKKN